MAQQNPQRLALGRALTDAREALGMTRADVKAKLRWSTDQVSRVELGKRVPVPAEIDILAGLFGMTAEQTAALHVLADAARKRESPAQVADYAQTYVTLEQAASEICYFDEVLIHGLLQAEGYARAVLATSGSDRVDAWLTERLARQEVLGRDDPVVVRALLGEGALHRQVGGQQVHREQLAHLIQLGQRPNVSIRILPFSAGVHRAMGARFTHVTLQVPATSRVYVEGLGVGAYINDDREAAVYRATFDRLWQTALGESESEAMIRRHM